MKTTAGCGLRHERLSQDVFTVPPAALPATTSVLTIVGGRIVHDELARPRPADTSPR